MSLTKSKAWRALESHALKSAEFDIAKLSKERPLKSDINGVTFDFSRHLVTNDTLKLLCDLAAQQDVAGNLSRMMAGDIVNITENRPAWHTALRDPNGPKDVRDTLARMKTIAEKMRADKTITDIVHIGIGGSDLGPRVVYDALENAGPRVHFVSNVDPEDARAALKNLSPKSTLVVAVSKTFTTQETMINLRHVRAWLKNDSRILAATSNVQAARAEGIADENILPMWDWVGGRYSVWSVVGISIAISCGFDVFEKFLKGAHAADRHAATAPYDKNIPVLMALLVVWYRNFLSCAAMAVLPYAHRLAQLPGHLQQLEMESNGKRVDRAGQPVDYATAAVIFGAAGTNAQHAFMQMIHQGPGIIPCDFIGISESARDGEGGRVLMANMEAQSKGLMIGTPGATPHAACPGNRPSTSIILPRLDAESLGVLLAVEEHKTAALGALWNINAFDQYGVELGKVIAKQLLA